MGEVTSGLLRDKFAPLWCCSVCEAPKLFWALCANVANETNAGRALKLNVVKQRENQEFCFSPIVKKLR